MDALGTITMYLPFVDSETADIIRDTMNRSSDYADFIKRLAKRVCTEETTEYAIYFAALHATNLYFTEEIEQIANKYGFEEILHPLIFSMGSLTGAKVQWNRAREAADNIIQNYDDAWIRLDMLLLKLEIDAFDFVGRRDTSQTIEEIEKLIERNPFFHVFESRFNDALSHMALLEGNPEEFMTRNEIASDIAEENNDPLRLAHLIRTRACVLQSVDRTAAQDLFLRAQSILIEYGDRNGVCNILYDLSAIDAVQGKYDTAIEKLHKVINLKESLGMPLGILAEQLSLYYNAIGDADAGYEWSKMAELEMKDQPTNIPYALLNQAWSLILKGECSKAEELLDQTKEMVLKSGMEPELGWYYFVNGLLEKSNLEFSDAEESIEQALEIFQRIGMGVRSNLCQYHLAETELLRESHGENTSWRLELLERARSEELPGILGQTLLLQAQFELLNGRSQEAKKHIDDVKELSQTPGLGYLQASLKSVADAFDN